MRPTFKTFSAGLLAAATGLAALSAPAAAGGSVSIVYTPTNARDARNLQAGLALYGIVNAVRNGASIRQYGNGNNAGIGQHGSGNLGIVHQEGSGHSGSIQQYGSNNAYGIFQFGRNTSASAVQHGSGQTGATFQFGW